MQELPFRGQFAAKGRDPSTAAGAADDVPVSGNELELFHQGDTQNIRSFALTAKVSPCLRDSVVNKAVRFG
jgi:hypothetical protein